MAFLLEYQDNAHLLASCRNRWARMMMGCIVLSFIECIVFERLSTPFSFFFIIEPSSTFIDA